MTEGWWHSNYFPEDYWQEEYWQDYGVYVSKGKAKKIVGFVFCIYFRSFLW